MNDLPSPENNRKKELIYGIFILLTIILVSLAVIVKLTISDNSDESSIVSNASTELEKALNEQDGPQYKQSEIEAKNLQQVKIGSRAPKWTLEYVSGLLPDHARKKFELDNEGSTNMVSLDSFKGEPLMLEFIATWCPHCKAMVPIVAKSVKNSGVNYVMIGAAKEPKKILRRFHKDYSGVQSPGIVVMGDEKTNKQYNIVGTPTMVFIDKNGIVKSIRTGEISSKELDKELESIK